MSDDDKKIVREQALAEAAKVCHDYAHSGQNIYSRQVAYACERRILALAPIARPAENFLRDEDLDLIRGALDSLGVSLSAHNHEWTVGEREIYEQAIMLTGGKV